MDSNAFLSCATLTASVSSLPAATSVIWRVIFLTLSPTETAPAVERQVDRAPTRLVSGAKAPRLPAPRSATEPTPIATPFSAVTVVPFPIATASSASIVF